MDSFICKVATKEELLKRWEYFIKKDKLNVTIIVFRYVFRYTFTKLSSISQVISKGKLKGIKGF